MLEIQQNAFEPLRDAVTIPEHLVLEACDLTAHEPPRELTGLQCLDIEQCTVTPESLQRWLIACPDLNTLCIDDTKIGELSWQSLPPRLQGLSVHGGELTHLLEPRVTCGLQRISLTSCKLRVVELPTSLASLQSVCLSRNEDLGCCPDLPWAAAPFELDLRGCGLTSWPDVEGVDKVGKLNLSNNAIQRIPAQVAKFFSLGCLHMQECELTEIDGAIRELRFLRELWLRDNKLRELPQGICDLPDLRVLELKGCQLQSWPEALAKVTTLEVLLLAQNRIERVPASIADFPKLRNLNLWKTGLRELPASLRGLDELRQLEISYNPLTNLPVLSGLPKLAYLGLCGLRDLDWQQGFDRLTTLQRIRYISFTNCDFETFDRRVLDIPDLERLDVNKTKVDPAVWQECREAFPHLTIWGA